MGRSKKRRENLIAENVARLARDPQGPRTQVVWDTAVQTLGLRLNQSGRHTWVVGGREAIGQWPEMRCPDARRKALGLVDEPKGRGGFTWRDGLLHYMENRVTAKKGRLIKDAPSSKVRVEQLENRMPFADVPMTATTPDQIGEFLRVYADRPSMRNALRATMRAVWSHCVEHQLVSAASPIIMKPLGTSPPRDYFSIEELEVFTGLLAANKYAPWVLSYAELTYVWALRGREALSLRWDWIRGDVLEIPERKASGRTDFQLWPEARDALDRLPRMDGCPLVFAPPRGYRPGRTFKTLAVAFSEVAREQWPGRKLTPHTLRRSRATHMRDAGYTDAEIIVLTGHATTAQLRAYIGKAPKHVMAGLSPAAMRKRAAERHG